MNKILVPVDFSDTSTNALLYAINLFKGSEFEITVLNTYKMSSNAFSMKSVDRIMEEEAQREMEILIQQVLDKEPGTILIPKILNTDAVATITSMGNSKAYDYIVMGTKGATGLKEVFIGSVAGGVISKTTAPVLVVPDNCHFGPLHEIAFAVSGKPFSSASVVEPLRKLVQIHSSRVNVLHIAEGEKQDMDEVLSPIKDLNLSVTYAIGTGNINERLNDYLTKVDVELLCLTRSRKGFFNRLFNESVTLKQTFSSSVPLLILHE